MDSELTLISHQSPLFLWQMFSNPGFPHTLSASQIPGRLMASASPTACVSAVPQSPEQLQPPDHVIAESYQLTGKLLIM